MYLQVKTRGLVPLDFKWLARLALRFQSWKAHV